MVLAITAPAAPATALPHGGSTSTLDCPAIVVLVESRNRSLEENLWGSRRSRLWGLCVNGSWGILSHGSHAESVLQVASIERCEDKCQRQVVSFHAAPDTATHGAHDETQISRGSGPRYNSAAFPVRPPHQLTAYQQYATYRASRCPPQPQ
jgi:hypothetical protein